MTDIVFGLAVLVLLVFIAVMTLVPPIKKQIYKTFEDKPNLPTLIVFIVSLCAMLGSLWYSEVVGYEPCRLCWYQRIFMYPIVLLAFVGLVIKDLKSLIYIKALAVTGLAIAVFHIIEQRLPQVGLSCGSVGQAVSCDTLWVNAFGMITIPTMAGVAFLAIMIVCIMQQAKMAK